MGSLTRLIETVNGSPLLVSKELADTIFSVLDDRGIEQAVEHRLQRDDDEDDEKKKDMYTSVDRRGIGVINIEGALTYKPNLFNMMCGEGISYTEILRSTQEMVDEGARAIVMNIDSGGGEAYGVFETANEMRRLTQEAGIPLYAYVDGRACSAAYALACVADEVFLNPAAEAGSIGVITSLVDDSEAERQAGIRRIYVTAGEEKIPFNEDGSFKESFIQDIQDKVDMLYVDFVQHVSTNMGITEQSVRNTEARVFMAQEAMSLGLVDGIATRREFSEYVRISII